MKGLVGCLVGFVVGGLAGASYMRYKKDKEMDQVIDEYEHEIDDLIEEINAIEENIENETNEEIEDDDQEEEDDAVEPLPDGYFNYGGVPKTRRDPMDKPASPKDLLTEHPEDSDEDTDILEENPLEEVTAMPKLISADKYDEDIEYQKDTLYYYQDDDVLTNSDDEEIDNEYEYVGDCMDKFDFRGSEEPMIHIRNEEMETDFEVQKVFASFHNV